MRLDNPERAGALVVLWAPLVLFGVILVVSAHQPHHQPAPKTDLVGLLRGIASTLSPPCAPSTPSESAVPPSTAAPSVLASPPPSAAASAAPSGAAQPGRRAQPAGPVRRQLGAPGASDVANPWASHE